jgi:tRNA pseudouridine13 synthase
LESEGKFPNYFGEQRFGTVSRNTHIVGERIVRGEFEGAAMAFLCEHSDGEKNQEAKAARKELFESRDFSSALNSFPKHLKFERTMIEHLARKDCDYIGAFRMLPRQMLLLFVHAFQSHIFNRLLSERIQEEMGKVEMEAGEYFCPIDGFGFPEVEKMDVDGWLCIKILGYNSNPNEREQTLLDEIGIKKEDFRIPKIPEIGSKGTFRTVFAPLVGFEFSDSIFRFSLQSGSYATSALREFMEIRKA